MCCHSGTPQITKWLLAWALKEQSKHMRKVKSEIADYFPRGMNLTLSSTVLCPSVWICTFGRHGECPPRLIHAQNFVIVVSSLFKWFIWAGQFELFIWCLYFPGKIQAGEADVGLESMGLTTDTGIIEQHPWCGISGSFGGYPEFVFEFRWSCVSQGSARFWSCQC